MNMEWIQQAFTEGRAISSSRESMSITTKLLEVRFLDTSSSTTFNNPETERELTIGKGVDVLYLHFLVFSLF